MECKNCASENILKNGKSRSGLQRFICKDCCRSWQKTYTYQSYKVESKEIILLTKEGCGIRSTARILNISPACASVSLVQGQTKPKLKGISLVFFLSVFSKITRWS